MPYCPHCGTEYETGDRFCGNCGETLTEKSELPEDKIDQNEARTDTSRRDSFFDGPRMTPPDRRPGVARKTIGGVAGLVILLGILLTARQLSLWSTTADGYYLVSAGLFLLIMSVLYAGVAWGFFRGERAKRLFSVTVGIVGAGCFLAALYFWITGRVFGRNVDAIFSALVWGFTGGLLYVVTVGIPRLATALASTRE